MAVIGKIRSYSWLLLVFIGLALLAFILGDFIKKGPKGPKQDLGEIAGEVVNVREFDLLYQEQVELFKKQRNVTSIDQNTSNQIREQLWEQIVRETILHKEAEEVGLLIKQKGEKKPSISSEEVESMILGPNFHPYVKQFFTQGRPENFDPVVVSQFLANIDKQDPYVRQLWDYYQNVIKEDRISTKYFNLISKGLYLTKKEVQKNVDSRTKLANFRFVTLRYNTIADASVKVTDQEMSEFYEKEKYKYEQEEGRTVEYVMFDVTPSSEDMIKGKEDILKLKEEFAKDSKPEEFVNYYADTKYEGRYHPKGELDAAIDSVFFTAPVNSMIGPYQVQNTFKIAKLVDRQARPDSLKASHILISYAGAYGASEKVVRTKEQAKVKADSILKVIKGDKAKLAEYASKNSDDPSAKDNNGDLGWFIDGQMIEAFNNSCVKATVGDVFSVETPFGFHIVNLTGKTAAKQKIKVAIVDRIVEPSEGTYNLAYNNATSFSSSVKNQEMFKKKVIEKGLNTRTADNIKETDRTLPGMETPTDLVRWAYEAELGDVSQVFDVGDKYVVGYLKEKREKGFAPLEQIKEEIMAGAVREKKAKMLMDKMNKQLAGTSDINDLAAKLNLKVDSAINLSYSAYGIPLLGSEPAVIGTVFGINQGKLSKPIKAKAGVVVVVVDQFVKMPSNTNIKQEKEQLTYFMRSRSQNEGYYALRKKANIIDNRGKFY